MLGNQRQYTGRFELLNSLNTFIGDLAVSAGSVPTISHDTGRSVNRTISSLLLDPKITKSVNPYSDRVRLVMDIPGQPSRYLGVYLFGSSSIVTATMGDYRTSALVDQTMILNFPLERSVSVPTNTQITKAISGILSEAGDFEFIVSDSTLQVGPTPLVWRPGTTALKVVNDMCALIGYYPFYFNNSGIGIIREQTDTSAGAPTFTYNFGDEIYEESLVKEDKYLGLPNRYIVVDTSALLLPVIGTYDVSASQPHSYANRGFYVRESTEVQGLQSTAHANLVAAALARQDGRQGKVSFTGPPNPFHDTYDIIQIDGTRYLETGWSLPMIEGSPMQHTLLEIVD